MSVPGTSTGALLTSARRRLRSRDQARQNRHDIAVHAMVTNNTVFSMPVCPVPTLLAEVKRRRVITQD